MPTYVLDMNDSELRIARVGADATDIVAQSIGFAMIDDRAIRFGESAMQQFRLHPRQVNNQLLESAEHRSACGARTQHRQPRRSRLPALLRAAA